MLKKLKLYFKLIGIDIRSQMQHKASFFMLTFSHFISTFVEIFAIWVLFDRFKLLKGWTLEEVALLYGAVHMGFAASEAFARGFDKFGVIVKNGDFDRLLLRPMGTLFQVATRELQLLRMGRFFQGFVVLVWGFTQLDLQFFSLTTVILILSIIGIACVFYGLFIIQATLSFWTIETLEIMNITTYGGVESAQYPLSIYPWGFRLFFTVIIPLGLAGYYPIAITLQQEAFPLWLAVIVPFAGVAFLMAACQLWKLGVQHYHSTGS